MLYTDEIHLRYQVGISSGILVLPRAIPAVLMASRVATGVTSPIILMVTSMFLRSCLSSPDQSNNFIFLFLVDGKLGDF